jgi:predicted dehydrogenase
METVNVGIIGGGLMGREVASAFARWCAFDEPDLPTPVLVAVADPADRAREWFRKIPSVRLLAADHRELLASPDVDVVYVAVPHHLHRAVYSDVLEAGKDLLAEKPFGIDLAAAEAVAAKAESSGRFVRCSSEFPFFPPAQKVFALAGSSGIGRVLEVNAGFHHASDLDPSKPANWKRQSSACGEIGVMGDLGMHVVHVPLRLGWAPRSVYAQLQKGYPDRPAPGDEGQRVACDTWDNATLHTWTEVAGHRVPMRLEMKRMAPGATDTWWIEVLGTDGGARFSTTEPKSLYAFFRTGRFGQTWSRTDLGFTPPFKTVTGGIFEFGFPDAIQQMWAAYLLERAGRLGDRFGCVTPAEAVASHRLFAAALESEARHAVIDVA